ncbi:MAG: YitT family protein [Muribaculaceae bacterium]|nr:YitT family protein [Muribaculaceae bacterium]MCF0214800.1 YitT family protein [Muribaculaceae bacterium]
MELKYGKRLWLSSRDYIFIVMGTLIYAIAFMGFILPQKVVIGGVTGIGTLVYFLTGIPVAVTQYGINIILLAFAFKQVGKRFVMKTIFGATCLSLFFAITQPIITAAYPNGFVEGQPFMSIIIGGFIGGFALGLVFIHNGSTGGTDIVAALVAKKTTVSVGRTMLYVDFCIISSSFLLFHNIDTVVYGLIILFLMSFTCDKIINSDRQAVQFIIISPHWMSIADAVNSRVRRGVTVINGMGWYSKRNVKILLVAVRKQEAVTIFRIAKTIDPQVFITQYNVNGVYGKGFDEIKVKTTDEDINDVVDEDFNLAKKAVSHSHHGRE